MRQVGAGTCGCGGQGGGISGLYSIDGEYFFLFIVCITTGYRWVAVFNVRFIGLREAMVGFRWDGHGGGGGNWG